MVRCIALDGLFGILIALRRTEQELGLMFQGYLFSTSYTRGEKKMNILREWGVLKPLLFAMILALPLSTAYAVPIVPVLKLSDGITSVTVSDGGVGDFNSASGAITYIDSIGSWFLNVSTGLTKPILGNVSEPHLDLSSINVSSSSGGTLTISFADGDFNVPASNYNVGMSLGGTLLTGGSITFDSYYYDSNAIDFVGGNLISSLNFSTSPFSGSTSALISPVGTSDLYSLAEIVTITHGGFGATSFNAEVPEPGTILLLGSGLIGLAFLRRSI